VSSEGDGLVVEFVTLSKEGNLVEILDPQEACFSAPPLSQTQKASIVFLLLAISC
jgi:hypothetical protein